MSSPNVKPNVIPPAQPGAGSTPAPSPDLAALLKDVLALKQKVAAQDKAAAQTAAAVIPKEIDWTKIDEKDIINFDIPIPVFEQEMPEYLNVKLIDRNYIPRWVHKLPERLGMCIAQGYQFVKEDDLDKSYNHPLKFDESGNYSHGDVVCLKVLKSRYFGAIKKNYLKTMAIHGKGMVQSKIAESVANTPYLADAIHKGAMTVYEPGDMEGVEFTPEMVGNATSSL